VGPFTRGLHGRRGDHRAGRQSHRWRSCQGGVTAGALGVHLSRGLLRHSRDRPRWVATATNRRALPHYRDRPERQLVFVGGPGEPFEPLMETEDGRSPAGDAVVSEVVLRDGQFLYFAGTDGSRGPEAGVPAPHPASENALQASLESRFPRPCPASLRTGAVGSRDKGIKSQGTSPRPMASTRPGGSRCRCCGYPGRRCCGSPPAPPTRRCSTAHPGGPGTSLMRDPPDPSPCRDSRRTCPSTTPTHCPPCRTSPTHWVASGLRDQETPPLPAPNIQQALVGTVVSDCAGNGAVGIFPRRFGGQAPTFGRIRGGSRQRNIAATVVA